MKRWLMIVIMGLLVGCVSVETVAHDDGSETIDTSTSGWFLLDVLPIISGDAEGGCKWFSDTVVASNNLLALNKELSARQQQLPTGAKLTIDPLVGYETVEGVFIFVITRRVFHTCVTIRKE